MPLTATQRQFVLNQLGVHPRGNPKRARAKSSGEFLDDNLKKALDDYLAAEAQVLELLQALHAIPGTESVCVEFDREMGTAQREVKVAKRQSGAGALQAATLRLDGFKERLRAAQVLAKANEKFYIGLDATQKALDQLRKHVHHDHIKGEADTAAASLVTAREQALAGDFVEAQKAWVAATKGVNDGNRFAESFAKYIPVRANAGRAITAAKAWGDASGAIGEADQLAVPAVRQYNQAMDRLKNLMADIKALIQTKVIDENENRLATLKGLAVTLKSNLDDRPPDMFPALKNEAGPTVVDEDVNALEADVAQLKADLAADRWGQVIFRGSTYMFRIFGAAERTAKRREAYDTQRRETLDKIATLASGGKKIEDKKGPDPLIGHIHSMQELVRRADRLASRESMRMEDGIAELKEIEKTVTQLVAIGNDAATYYNTRVPADERFERLKQLPAADAMKSAIAGIEALMAAAVQATGVINAKSAINSGVMEDHFAGTQDWGGAAATVARAVKEMAAAEALAGELSAAVDLKDLADGAGDALKLGLAEAALRKAATTAQARPHAALAADEFGKVFASLDQVLQLTTAGTLPAAQTQLQSAADQLLRAQIVQAEHERFEQARLAVQLRADALAVLTVPPAASIQGKTDLVVAAIQRAVALDVKRDWPAAQAMLAEAEAAATMAEKVRDLRAAYNLRELDLTNLNAPLTDPRKGQVSATLAKARAAADEFDLDYANRFLDNADAQIAGATVASLAGTPDAPAFLAAVEKMLKATGGQELLARATDNPTQLRNKDQITGQDGKAIAHGKQMKSGPELLDEVVKGLPDTVAYKVLAALCEQRFGVKLQVSAAYIQGNTVKEEVRTGTGSENHVEHSGLKNYTQRHKSALKIYEMLALVPEQARDNPSMKVVERRTAVKNLRLEGGRVKAERDSGGFYQAQDDTGEGLVVMKGRPNGESMQAFGANLRGGANPQLPQSEPGYETADDTAVDYFDFATVHEIGHAVDDRMRFMASRMGQAAFGGWTNYGGNIQPIVDAVAKFCDYGDTDEQKQYIADLITGNKPDAPRAPPSEALAWEDGRKKVAAWYAIATNEKLWWNQGQCDAVTIDGVIYQEAYKGRWNSYLASARSKGLTGYQFRAPGEWFAELYAGYHCEKLKKGHPARQWLSSLSL